MAGLEDLPTPALTAYPLPQQAISRAWLSRPALQVASGLLGALLAHDCADGTVVVRLTEVEAYEGTADPGSHAFRGPTPRTRVMFGPAGHLYVYFSYGMHWCTNVVCGPDGTASAVLLRAGEVVAGHELARQRRPAARVDRDLARGPARLAAALGIAKAQHGTDVCGDGPVRLLAGPSVPPDRVQSGPRVGVSGAGGDGAVHPWRFWLDGEPTVSTYRPATGRTRARRRG